MSIKIKHGKFYTSDDILRDVTNLNSFVRYLILEIPENSAFGMDAKDFQGFGLFLDLQNAMIKAATKRGFKQSKKDQAEVETEARTNRAATNLAAYFSTDTSDADRVKLEGQVTLKQIENVCDRNRNYIDYLEPEVTKAKAEIEFAESLLEKRRAVS